MKRLITILSILLILVGCTNNQTDLKFEKSVAIEIFPTLLDSIHFDRRLFPPPPPPPPNYTKTDTIKTKLPDSIIIAEWEKRKKELKKDTTKLIVAIVDSTYKLENRAKKEFNRFYKGNSIKLDTTIKGERYKIDISKLKHSEKTRLIYRSELPKKNVWKPNYDFYLSGIIGFSRIQFDQTKKYGVLNFSFGCGGLCGFSGIALIRKINGNWIIDKIIVTAVS